MADADNLLIEQALSGDQRAYADILEKYRGPVYGLILRMVKNKEELLSLIIDPILERFGDQVGLGKEESNEI